MFDGAADIDAAWRAGLKPEPLLTVSEWAERNRMLSSKGSAEPGPWRNSRTPYLAEIMDCLSPSHPAQRVVFMKGAQVGATESGNNWIGYVIQHAPGPMLTVQPTVELAKRFSRQRIEPLLEETPSLRGLVAAARERDSGNTMLSKDFAGGQLVLTGANSAVGLRSMSARYLFMDEVDAYPGDVEGEGDPIALASARARTFGRRKKEYLVSTPTIEGASRIEREYLASDQRRFFLPCPHCGAMQWLQFERLRWEKGRPETAAYVCAECDVPIEERHKTWMLGAGEWRPTAEAQAAHVVGFHISSLYSPVGWLSWEQIARDWEAAQGKVQALKTFANTVLGKTWQEQGDAPEWERLAERREDYRLGTVPEDAAVLTAGVDVQDDRLECDVWAWGAGFTSWLVDHVSIAGSPREPETWARLSEILNRAWPRQGGGLVRIGKACVDTGGRDTAAVYGHLRSLADSRIAPVKGVDGWNKAAPVQGPTPVDALVNGKKLRRGLKLWTVSVSTWKADLYRRLWLKRTEAEEYPRGWVHLPQGVEIEWVKQLVAEQLRTVTDRRGFQRQEWAKLRDRNEALDCAVYARAALWLMGADRYGDRFWRQAADAIEPEPVPVAVTVPPTAPAVAAPPAVRFRESSWIRR